MLELTTELIEPRRLDLIPHNPLLPHLSSISLGFVFKRSGESAHLDRSGTDLV